VHVSTDSGDHLDEMDEDRKPDLISRDFIRLIAIWSIVPAWLIAGAFLGWLADLWLHTFPYGIGIGLMVGLVLSVRDVMRLRESL
jgi:F0F1-type ATP synthase assembly protein I